ncbi:MAG TPA: hypothetical protein V6D14_17710 [Coleofasciculaceae cyanobacterium]|jgi:putative DNA primase/helicase
MSTDLQSQQAFDIRNFLDRLEPAKEKNKYVCPVCEGHNLSIEPNTGKYQCFNGCSNRDIREKIKPWAELMEEKRQGSASVKSAKLKGGAPKAYKSATKKPMPLPFGELALASLSSVPNDIPQPTALAPELAPKSTREKLLGKGVTGQELEQLTVVIYDYGDGRKAYRYQCPCANSDKGHEKTFSISRIDESGKTQWNKGKCSWAAYRQAEVIAAVEVIASEKVAVILSHEGEKCVEAARAEKLAGITAVGTPREEDWLFILNEIKSKLGSRPFILAHCQDNDETGIKKAEKIAASAARTQVPFVAINLKTIYPDLCDKGDIADILASGMTGDELANLILEEIKNARLNQEEESFDDHDDDFFSGDTSELNPDANFNQKALNFLYGDKPWMCADNKLYCWQGNHYKYVPDAVERPKIASFCNSYIVPVPDGNGGFKATYPYAKPAKVEEVLKWVKMRFEVDPSLLNPSGINCTNGVLAVKWESGKPVRHLEEHDPTKHYFVYEPLVRYDPQADSTDCDRLLQCLDEPQQQVLLRNLAASIDLPEVRKRRGREVRVLLACGLGSNGKDALRQTVSIIFGHSGMTSVSLADFAHYDDGRKFALAPLLYSKVNWASENPETARLDKIQSLKLFATGNVLHSERKGKDHVEFIPKAVGLFNLNHVPSFQGVIQAIQDRIAPLEFIKTFKKNPDPNNPNELQADPRFAYDEEFVRTSVAPAFLNKMLDALEALIEEGIDYSCTTDAFKLMQKENNHLFQFCEDVGLGYLANGEMTAKGLWSLLEQWYIDNGTLLIDDDGKKRQWIEQVRPSDKNVKGINQVIPRILSLFPKAKKGTKYDEVAKRSVPTITGIGINAPPPLPLTIENTRTTIENTRTTPAPLTAPQSTQNQDSRTTRTTFIEPESVENKNGDCLTSSPEAIQKELNLEHSGAADSEPRHSNTDSDEKWCGNTEDNVNSGAGNVNKSVELSFDPQANAELMLEALEGENPYAMLSALLECWSDEQKAQVRMHLTAEQLEAIRCVLRKNKLSTQPNPEVSATEDRKPQLRVGSRVEWTGDAYDGAWGCVGEVVEQVFSDYKVRWTRQDGTFFNRREEVGSLRLIS